MISNHDMSPEEALGRVGNLQTLKLYGIESTSTGSFREMLARLSRLEILELGDCSLDAPAFWTLPCKGNLRKLVITMYVMQEGEMASITP